MEVLESVRIHEFIVSYLILKNIEKYNAKYSEKSVITITSTPK